MSIGVLQHLPGFVDGDPIYISVEKIEDILEIDYIKRWSADYQLEACEVDNIYRKHDSCYIQAVVYNKKTNLNERWVVAIVFHPYEEIRDLLEKHFVDRLLNK
jgi:hypothetical protein